jgi:histidinol-phosphate/aromatic aminotransferase/cobyric acid decarboxylase-like protein
VHRHRRFFGGVAAALGSVRFAPTLGAFAQAGARPALQTPPPPAEYDAYVKLAANENNYGPPEGVLKAMNNAWKYSNRYGYPDGGIVQEIAKHHSVKPENILLTAGSGEVLDVVGTTFLAGGK